jgi:Tfp pilus assembly protein PilN
MNDTQIGESMRSLPRTSASPAFTHEVMRRVRTNEGERPLVWRVGAAFAMAACLIAVVQLNVVQQRQQARTVALRAEQQQLEADLAAVKKIASDAEPVVVLENDQGTRVIVDLDSAVQPASLRQYD